MKYHYTSLNQDGTYRELGQFDKKWSGEELRDWIGGMLELIPRPYYPKGMTGTVWGHEEGRFNEDNRRNPHMKVLTDNEGREWDCVGDLLLEQTEIQYTKWIATKQNG